MNYLGFDQQKLSNTVKSLNLLLANYHIYYQNLRNFHWNIQGENFFDLHIKFEELYTDAHTKIDEIAERILTLRAKPLSLYSVYLDQSEISEARKTDNDREMVKTILENHRILIAQIRDVLQNADDADDEGTIDMVGGFLGNLEKKSWMLDAWISHQHVRIDL